eukprot:COSAG06_NODE_56716_length_283_cov_1.027174_2_plen_29_part_01
MTGARDWQYSTATVLLQHSVRQVRLFPPP